MKKFTNLWKLLDEYERGVVIPVIQRDYAQGRKGNEHIRRRFLKEIKKQIENEINDADQSRENDRSVVLDFIYGSEENDAFQPLDGQQRLTTLWLLHWYLSLRSDNFDDLDRLSKFSYKTRPSSADFCKALCDKDKMKALIQNNGADHLARSIKKQTWFYSEWLLDPTISAMLRAISGDDGAGIQSVFKSGVDGKEVDYQKYREALKNGMSFHVISIGTDQLPSPDDLYVKMNARGKKLTNFENFKADLFGWMTANLGGDAHGLTLKIDNDWTDFFWKSARNSLGKDFDAHSEYFDNIFFSFINRYFYNELLINKNQSGEENNEYNSHLDKLLGAGARGGAADDTRIRYTEFDAYSEVLTGTDKAEALRQIDKIIGIYSDAGIRDLIENEFPQKDNDITDDDPMQSGALYSFIPRVVKENKSDAKKLAPTTQKERVYFLAVCLFLKSCGAADDFDETKFKRWMRVVRNLTENAEISSRRAMEACMREINRLWEKTCEVDRDVYESLEKLDITKAESALDRQMREEKEKAEEILSGRASEEKIVRAENYSFFNGAIRFLYHDKDGKVDFGDNFDTKFENAKKLFDDNSNKVPIETVLKFLKLFSGFDDIYKKHFFTTIGYHPRYECWKRNILCSKEDEKTYIKVHELLTGGACENRKDIENREDIDIYELFLNSGMAEKICNKSDGYRYRVHSYKGGTAIHKKSSQSDYIYVNRVKFEEYKKLRELEIVDKAIKVENEYTGGENGGFYWGNIKFECKKEMETGGEAALEVGETYSLYDGKIYDNEKAVCDFNELKVK